MSFPHEVRPDILNSLYPGIRDTFDDFHNHSDPAYIPDLPKHQFDTDDLTSYLAVPPFDSPFSSLSGLSSFPPSYINTPLGDDQEYAGGGSGSDSDSDFESSPLAEGNAATATRDVRSLAYNM
jgi:hypothetical protein